jgi:hypothetical protein
MEEMMATDKTGVNAEKGDTAGQVDHAGPVDRGKGTARYVANLLNVGGSMLYGALVA